MADLCNREIESCPHHRSFFYFLVFHLLPYPKKVATILISYLEYVCILIKQATL